MRPTPGARQERGQLQDWYLTLTEFSSWSMEGKQAVRATAGVWIQVISLFCWCQFASAQPMPPMRFMPADSANYSARGSRTIDRIVIHTIEGSEAGAISWFQDSSSGVSAHYVVSHTGRLTRMLRDSDIGYHCRTWNSRSIGIENEGYAHRDTWTRPQLGRLADLTAYLCRRYGLPADRTHIVGHSEVPGNVHRDPGPHFDWSRFVSMVRSRLSGSSTTRAPTSPPTARPSAYEVTASSLNVRRSAWGTRLGTTPRGTRFVATGARDGDWREVFYSGGKAWVHSSYIRVTAATIQEVATSSLNVRVGASHQNHALGDRRAGPEIRRGFGRGGVATRAVRRT